MQQLSELQNAFLGTLAGTVEVTVMQSTNYWKNASQQGLPFTINPRVTYRGYFANCANNGAAICYQFAANGAIKKLMTGGKVRELSAAEQMTAGFLAGASSTVVCSPLELVMIQQQRNGGSFLGTFGSMLSKGFGNFYRGASMCAFREGIYTCAYLGIAPAIRQAVMKRNPDMSSDAARVPGSIAAGIIGCFTSHPSDTIKTCQQGDITKTKYGSVRQTYQTIVKESGIAGLYRGSLWRCFRQICAVFILDKTREELSRVIFPEHFDD